MANIKDNNNDFTANIIEAEQESCSNDIPYLFEDNRSIESFEDELLFDMVQEFIEKVTSEKKRKALYEYMLDLLDED